MYAHYFQVLKTKMDSLLEEKDKQVCFVLHTHTCVCVCDYIYIYIYVCVCTYIYIGRRDDKEAS